MVDAIFGKSTIWNWGGTWVTQSGVRRFKGRWGTTEKIYKYFTRIQNKAIYDSSPEILSSNYPDFFVLPYNKLNKQAS